MQIVVTRYCLGNSDKEKEYMLSMENVPEHSQPWLVECMLSEAMDKGSTVYDRLYMIHRTQYE
jgi:hypothetical protein